MTQNNRGKAVLHTLIRKGFAGLMIAGSYTVADLPWAQVAGFGPPAWITAQFMKPQEPDCTQPQREATRPALSAETQGRIQGWWL